MPLFTFFHLSFQFGGKLISFQYDKTALAQQTAAAPQQPGFVTPSAVKKTVSISQVITENTLMARAQALEVALQQGDYIEFCRKRSSGSHAPHERFLWECLRTNFEPNPSSEILSLLGFSPDEVNIKVCFLTRSKDLYTHLQEK